MSKAELKAMAEEATVDCYTDDEQISGWHTMIADNLATPFQTKVLGIDVTVEDIDLRHGTCIIAICARGALRQPIPILDLPLPIPAPDGVEWIEAYRHWLG
jgi:hypothetical protein